MFPKLLVFLLTWCLWASAAGPLTFRITFGDVRDRPADYSGSIRLTAGEVTRIEPWRFFDGDAVEGLTGWKLQVKKTRFEDQPDKPRPMMTETPAVNVVPAGVNVTVEAPSAATARVSTVQGNFEIPLAELRYDRVLRYLGGDVIVQRAPSVRQVSPPSREKPVEHFDYPSLATAADGSVWYAWQGYRQGGDHVYARHSTASGFSDTERLTRQKGDIFRTATAIDGAGRVWVVWSRREGRNWDLRARRHETGSWQPVQQITSGSRPNIFHRLVASRAGELHLVWVGHDGGQSYVYWSRLSGDSWSAPKRISGPSAWAPEAATDSSGNLWVTWDSYRNGNYDIYLRKIDRRGDLGEEIQVTKSSLFQTHPTVAVDAGDRVWLAWHESGPNWGKDWTHEDNRRATVLYTGRTPKVAVLDNGVWKEPAADLITAVPLRYRRYVQYPRIVADRQGRIWCGLQLRTGAVNNRDDFWAFDGRWEFFLTRFEGHRWSPPMPIPDSSLRPEGPLLMSPGKNGIRMTWTNDNRPIFAPAFYGWIYNRNEIFAARFAAGGATTQPSLEPFAERHVRLPAVHPNEPADLARIRSYRTEFGGRQLRILRGDFHRHTEISSDGAGDGSLEVYYRYMIDAAGMDTGIVGDHNIGNDDEYDWWRTEKAADLFHIAGRFTPMFGYERSPSYPNGHRNVVFAQRGVRTLPISREEMRGKIRTGPILYPYLRKYNGIAMTHSTATSQGTDWGDNDPQLEPLTEVYQGYHASYEYEGAPRAESPNLRVQVHGAYRPAGMWWNALKKGLKLGVEASSDHISTHTSYTLIYSPSTEREDILESMRARHAYAATDNIIIDYQAVEAGGRTHFMGEAFKTGSAPELRFKVIGTDLITKVDVIKDQRFVYSSSPNAKQVEFTFHDTKPGNGESYYYLRVQQVDRNLAWSSPIWVDYR